MIESMYGAEVFYEEAVNIVLPDAYEGAVKEQELQVRRLSRGGAGFLRQGGRRVQVHRRRLSRGQARPVQGP